MGPQCQDAGQQTLLSRGDLQAVLSEGSRWDGPHQLLDFSLCACIKN
jgi:hypothetical protein